MSATRRRQPPDWNLPLTRPLKPVVKTQAMELSTLHDAAAFILDKLSPQERVRQEWIEAASALLNAATTKRPADILVATDQVAASLRANGYLLGAKRQR